MVQRSDVVTAYHTFLGRGPESEDVVVAHEAVPTLADLGRHLMRTDEFRRRLLREAITSTLPKWVCTVIRHDLKLWVDLNDAGVSAGCLQGDWERTETDLILSLLSPGTTFVDVGANIGWFTVLAANAVGPEGRVYAFEPRADRYVHLIRSIEDNGLRDRVVAEQVGLGADVSEMALGWVPAENNPGHSFLMSGAPPEGAEHLAEVKVIPLDSINIDRPVRVMKIDVEGAEPQVIAGARALIERDHPLLLLEIFPRWLETVSKTSAAVFMNDLRLLGYRIHRLSEFGLGRELHPGEDGVENGLPEYFTVAAISQADYPLLIADRLDHRVDDLEQLVRTLRQARSVAEVRAEAAEQAATETQQAAHDRIFNAETHSAEAEIRAVAAETRAIAAEAAARAAERATEAARMAGLEQLTKLNDAVAKGKLAATAAGVEIDRLSKESSRANEQLHGIQSSTLWCATFPIRRLGEMVPPGGRLGVRRAMRLAWWTVTFQAAHRLREYRLLRKGATGIPPSPPYVVDTTPLPASAATGSAAVRIPWFVMPQGHGAPGPASLPAPTKPRVLIIDSRWPRPDRDSGSVDAVLQALAFRDLGYEVIFVGDAEFADASAYRAQLERLGVVCLSPAVCPSVEDFLHRDGTTLTLCVLSRVNSGGRYLEAVRHYAPRAVIVFNTVDLHHLREIRAARLAGDSNGLRMAEATAERELYIVRQADATIVVSAFECAELERKVPGAAIFQMPLARPVRARGTIPNFEARSGIGFVGGFDHHPNVDAIQFFLDDIWPLVVRALPNAEFTIVGEHLPDSIVARLPRPVRYLGPLKDLSPWLDRLRLTVAPLRYGAGAKGKIASTLAAGVPCVATSIALEGMNLSDGMHVAAADTPEQFARQIVQTYSDRAVWERLSYEGHALAESQFSVGAAECRLAAMLDALNVPVCMDDAASGTVAMAA